ncbi:hypothetical protein H6P81_014119 [Aristolochia fimbriata]|uniref:Uncharacterized protein n=1 Tax=Aristolochia fimbriata TaxID=158543 RepID=A0AAV7EJY1_ARIFI|nr:hypothetical protein H6P81_014119 [Aristolochia fimbriata]
MYAFPAETKALLLGYGLRVLVQGHGSPSVEPVYSFQEPNNTSTTALLHPTISEDFHPPKVARLRFSALGVQPCRLSPPNT